MDRDRVKDIFTCSTKALDELTESSPWLSWKQKEYAVITRVTRKFKIKNGYFTRQVSALLAAYSALKRIK